MKINECPKGKEIIVKCLNCEDKFKCRLKALGLYEGSKITIVRSFSGCTIIKIKNANYALRDTDIKNITCLWTSCKK